MELLFEHIKRPRAREKNGPQEEADDHALGKSRAGIGTKIHLVCDGNGLPITAEISPGQAHEARFCLDVIDGIEIASAVGRARKRPERLSGDKAYSSFEIRQGLKGRAIKPVIPVKKDQRRDPRFDKKSYRKRNIIERCIAWIKESRRISSRYEKLAIHFLGMVKLGMIMRYLR
jgi:transposase